jgi:AraC-like DNA-binding protein
MQTRVESLGQDQAASPAKPVLEKRLVRIGVSTLGMPQERAYELWQHAMGATYEIARPPGSFYMDMSMWNLGDVLVGHSAYGARSHRRTPRKARADQVDHYRLLYQTQGTLRIDADGHRLTVPPGGILISDMARPEHLDVDEGAGVAVFIPRELLDEALPRPLDLHGLALEGLNASLLGAHLTTISKHVADLTISQAPSVGLSILNILSATLLPTAETLNRASSSLESTVLRQACRFIELHLEEPELSPDTLCKAFKISRATLYRLFEPFGGVLAHIKERRLMRIHRLLSTTERPLILARVAEDHGFRNTAHFSSSFREMFGYSPSEVRSQIAALPFSGELSGQASGDISAMLRRLRG